ncbi:MAG TPA: hypothetical protein VMT79_00035, partial [Candidatus Binatia bacterium]|nr:hypothetical protein [Candidatus Binatia bacterium]
MLILLLIAQFIDRGLALLIPLRIAHLPGTSAVAAISGTIISVAAGTATLSSSGAGRLAQGIPAARLLLIGLLAGGPLCAVLGLGQSWVLLLV